MNICVFNPEILNAGIAAKFHGYAIEFIINYVDYILLDSKSIIGKIRRMLKFKKNLRNAGCRKKIKYLFSINKLKSDKDLLIGFGIPEKYYTKINIFNGKKIFHLMDYYINVQYNVDFLKKNEIDFVIGHCQMDEDCDMFKQYYTDYIGKVISLPFGYHERFICINDFEKRINKAVGLGSINPIQDPLLPSYQTKELRSFFSNEKFMHPVRKYIQDNEDIFSELIDSMFPSPIKQKDFSYNAVERLNEYKMFINDYGLSHFPPARTYEGIACGCVMVAPRDSVYIKLGFIPDVNYISYIENDFMDLQSKIKYYQKNANELLLIQKNSLELAKNFQHKTIAVKLFNELEKLNDRV